MVSAFLLLGQLESSLSIPFSYERTSARSSLEPRLDKHGSRPGCLPSPPLGGPAGQVGCMIYCIPNNVDIRMANTSINIKSLQMLYLICLCLSYYNICTVYF